MSQHTPGPLTCDGFRLLDSKGRQLARVSAGGATLHADEATANKRMFAKAPEMLAIIRECLDSWPASAMPLDRMKAMLREIEGRA